MNISLADRLPFKPDQPQDDPRELRNRTANGEVAGRTTGLASLAAIIFAITAAHPAAGATPTPTPACPSVITQSTSQAVATANSGSCNSGAASGLLHTDNGYWRAFNMATITASLSPCARTLRMSSGVILKREPSVSMRAINTASLRPSLLNSTRSRIVTA